MKPRLSLLLLVLLVSACTETTENPTDPVGGREVITLEDGKAYILKSEDRNTPQIEISISKDYFGIAQLSTDGTGVSPITVMSTAGVVDVIQSRIEGGNEITVTDRDGDGLADYRITIPRDKTAGGSSKVEEIKHSFSIVRAGEGKQKGEQSGADRPLSR